ncbi:MAG: type I DNA topoisomerase [Rhodospirillales bacterium]|nr:type I DNA topoisomerase [Rhodospirillales bacterium]
MNIVVVESPAKAKTINKYLGKDFTVLASFGHVRDLPAKDGSVKPDQDFAMEWEVDARSEKHLREIAKALKGADQLILATDPDREGEAISWHVREELERRKALKGVAVKRVVFNEITKSAVTQAMKEPRDLDHALVDAYMARRALDYLVGFTLSPVLWRKLPGSRSAGRVQSVALRLICEREAEIELFRAREYWTVEADFTGKAGTPVTAQLTHLDGQKLDKFGLPDQAAAQRAQARIAAEAFEVWRVEKKKVKRHPFAPFTTSTLQQEASRKLGFSAKHTMSVAQRLYEGVDIGGETVGLITYMRTDGVSMAAEAVGAARSLITRTFGADYLPPQPRLYKAKAKNAQEAHEAIRPTDLFRRPDEVVRHLDRDQHRLYELIWKRTVASQMESAEMDQVIAEFADARRQTVLRATGSTIAFDGFLRLYREDKDDPDENGEDGKRLPPLAEGEAQSTGAIRPIQHFTEPLPRYTEASLVKKLEELGIGRPSTYASILSVLQDRNYVRLDAKRFIPEDRGRLVTAFLENFFGHYVEYGFTADLEERLDDISDGKIDWKKVLGEFWHPFIRSVDDTKELRVSDVLTALDQSLGPHFFPEVDGKDSRICPTCAEGRLNLKLGKFGAFIGCSNYPDCRYTRPLAVANGANGGAEDDNGPRELGQSPAGLAVTLRKGPYGHYVQEGEASGEGKAKTKPKRVSLPKGLEPAAVDLDKAIKLLGLPRAIGPHPETGQMISAGIGRFGPYLKHGDAFKSLPAGDDVLEVGLNRAVDILATAKGRGGRGARAPGRELGKHPDDGAPVTVQDGRYGPYVSHGKVNATLPNGLTPDAVTLERAVELLAARAAKGPAKKPARAAARKAPAKSAAKTPAKSDVAKPAKPAKAPRRKAS